MKEYDLIVVGGGPAGMAAALAASDCGIEKIAVLDREEELGGILRQCIHSGFGLHRLGEELTGPEYADVFARQVKKRGIFVYYEATVTKITRDRVVTVQSREGLEKLRGKTVVLAMGCRERSRGALNLCGSRPAGVYSAGTAQRLMNCEGYAVGKRVVILGSGDIGLIMARRMTLEGAKVEAVCEVMPYSGGLTRNLVQCLEDFLIPLYLSTTVAEIHGKDRVEGVTVGEVDEQRRIKKETCRYLPCDTLLLSVGLIPENELTRDLGVELSPVTGGATVDETRQTNVAGVFACGNVLHVHDLVDYVSEEAEIAGRGAAAFIKGELKEGQTLPVLAGEGVRYVLPQRVHPHRGEDLYLFLRVASPMKKTAISVSCGDRILSRRIRQKCAPGEMERILIQGKDLASCREAITVSVEELK